MQPLSIKDWEARVSVRIDGTGRLGGDGVAFWYAAEPGVQGKAYGSKEQWKGLGVFLDTFDNDGKRDNPYISVVLNDGTKTYDSATDAKDIELGGCRASVRKADSATVLRVSYRGSTRQLDVAYDLNANGAWRPCFSGVVDLPLNYYLGVSAATGGVSDNHDVNYFELRRLDMDDGAPSAAQGASFFPRGQEPGTTAERRARERRDEPAAAPQPPAAPEPTAESRQLEELRRQIERLKKAQGGAPASAPAPVKEEQQATATTTAAATTATATVGAAPATGSVAERMAALERQLGELNGRLAAVDKVTEGVHRVTATLEQLKQQLSASTNKPAAKYDDTQFVFPSFSLFHSFSRVREHVMLTVVDWHRLRNELSKQVEEVRRTAARAQESMTALVARGVGSVDQAVQTVSAKVDAVAAKTVQKGESGVMTFLLICVMVAETVLVLVLFLKNRRTEKFDKMW